MIDVLQINIAIILIATATSEKPENLRIDALLSATVEPSENVILFDGDKMYEFNVVTFELGKPLAPAEYFKGIDFPVDALTLDRRTSNGEIVNKICFCKGGTFYLRLFAKNLNNDTKLLEQTESLEYLRNTTKPREFKIEVDGITFDTSVEIGEDVNYFLCDDNEVLEATMKKGYFSQIISMTRISMSVDKIRGCTGLTMVRVENEPFLLMSTGHQLKMFEMESGRPRKLMKTIDVQEDIIGKSSILTYTIAALSFAIVVFIIIIGVLILYINFRTKTIQSKVMWDKTTMESRIDHTRSPEPSGILTKKSSKMLSEPLALKTLKSQAKSP